MARSAPCGFLEDEVARDAAGPIAGPFGVRFDPDKLDARRRAMVAHLPASGLVLVVLGGSHDLGLYLGDGVLYVRVTARSYPG